MARLGLLAGKNGMTLDLPFRSYGKDQLPRGQSYAAGRDQIAEALRAAGAEIGLLSLGRTDSDAGHQRTMLFDVYWKGDGGTRSFGREPDDDAERLLMRWHAVPSGIRADIAAQVTERWLPQACKWAASAPARGNVWRAVDHRWLLWMSGAALEVDIS